MPTRTLIRPCCGRCTLRALLALLAPPSMRQPALVPHQRRQHLQLTALRRRRQPCGLLDCRGVGTAWCGRNASSSSKAPMRTSLVACGCQLTQPSTHPRRTRSQCPLTHAHCPSARLHRAWTTAWPATECRQPAPLVARCPSSLWSRLTREFLGHAHAHHHHQQQQQQHQRLRTTAAWPCTSADSLATLHSRGWTCRRRHCRGW